MNTCLKTFFVSALLMSLAHVSQAQFHFLVPREGYQSDTIVHHHVTDTSHHHINDTTVHHRIKKPWPEFHYPVKQYFFQGQVVMAFADIGFHAIAGYRLGQFGIFGGGIGIDYIFIPLAVGNNNDPFNGVYLPVFAHYEGDILKKRLTPYYAFEAGYGFRFTSDSNDGYIEVNPIANTPVHPVYKYSGGFTGGFDFGLKLYARHKVCATWALTLDVQQAADKYSNYFYNSIGQDIKVSYSSTALILIPGIKISCGF